MSNNRRPGVPLEARGQIIRLGMHQGREVAFLDSTTDPIVTLDFQKGQPLPSVRANEVATLLRDPFLANALRGCRNMDARRDVLIPIARQGYDVEDALAPTPQGSPDPVQAPDPQPQPVGVRTDFDPSDFVTKAEHRTLADMVATVDGTLNMQIGALAKQVSDLSPTVIHIDGREPVTLPADELVHEKCAEVIESIEDGLHPYLTGEPGTGKSRMVATIAKAFGFPPERTHFFSVSNMDQKNSLLGFIRPTDGEFVPGPGYHAYKGDLSFFDELDAGNGAAMNALNTLLDSPFVTFPNGETLERPEHLFIIGAGNTVGKGGDMMFLRNQMDAATRNRWVFHHVSYDRNIERGVVTPILGADLANRWLNHCWQIRENLEGERVVFSTRNIRHGALQLRRGRPIEHIVASALLPGESDDIIRKSGALNWA